LKIGIEANGVLGWRGPSRNIRNLINALSEEGRDNEYFLFACTPIKEYVSGRSNLCSVLVPLKKCIPWLNVSLPIEVRKHRIDVFIFPQANFWLWKPVKTIVIMRSATIEPWEPNLIDKFSALVKRARLKKIADRVGAVSYFNATQLELTCGIPEETVEIIHNGVDPVFLDESIESAEGYGEYLLFIGGNEKRKNFERTVRAFSLLLGKLGSLKLLVVGGQYGNEPSTDKKRLLVTELGIKDSVVFYGIETSASRIASLYKGARAVVYPSTQETFGMVAIEAMACGCPVAASYMPSIPEIAKDAALYFDPYDIENMAEQIGRVLTDEPLRQKLIAKGRERVKFYSWKVPAKKILNLCDSLTKTSLT
jgi:glycosyltransferase involved in cell wall biosynthesis